MVRTMAECASMLLLPLLLFLAAQPAFGQQDVAEDHPAEGWTDPSAVLRLGFWTKGAKAVLSFPAADGPFSLCLWLRLPFTDCRCRLLQLSWNGSCRYLDVDDNRLQHVDADGAKSELLDQDLPHDVWMHVCLAFTDNTTSIISNNTKQTLETALGEKHNDKEVKSTSNSNMEVFSGDEFIGEIADVLLINFEVTIEQQSLFAKCNQTLSVDSVKPSISKHGNVKEDVFALTDLCKPAASEVVMLFLGPTLGVNQHTSEKFCSRVGGRLLNPTERDLNALINIAQNLNLPSKNFLLKTTKENNTTLCKTFELSLVGSQATVNVVVRECEENTYFVGCAVPTGKAYGFTVFLPTRYTIELQAQEHGGKLVLSSPTCERLLIEPKYNDEDFKNTLTYESYGDTLYTFENDTMENDVTGRKHWQCLNSDENLHVTAILTTCGNNGYTCGNGQCILLEEKCNGKFDCEDKTDEGWQNGCKVMIDPPSSYLPEVCPSEEPVLDLDLSSIYVKNIDVASGAITIHMEIEVSWKDHELSFLFLNNSNNRKYLTVEDASKIWKPELSVNESHPDNDVAYKMGENVLVRHSVQADGEGYATHYDGYEALIYNDSNYKLSKITNFEHIVICPFDLVAFPFDSTVCEFGVQIEGTTSCHPVWNRDLTLLKITSEAQDLTLFSISPMVFRLDNNTHQGPGSATIVIKFLVSRLFHSYLVTAFLPCLVLTVLGLTTLSYFKPEDFSSRISVTVSLLLVLVTVYSQTVAYIPQSSSTKIIESFFFYCIIRLSIVFVFHSMTRRDPKKEATLTSSETAVFSVKEEPFTHKMMSVYVPNQSPGVVPRPYPTRSNRREISSQESIQLTVRGSGYVLDALLLASFIAFVVSDKMQKQREFERDTF